MPGVDAGFWLTPTDRRATWRKRIDDRRACQALRKEV